MRVGLITPLLCLYTDRYCLAGDHVMTIGIYRLCFEGTSNCYVGQSVDIERRYKEHLNSLLNNKANYKMMAAYKLYGLPDLEILCECSIQELNTLESEAIEIFDSVNSGYNVYISAFDAPVLNGENNGNSKHSNEQILQVANLLMDPKNTANKIKEITGVSINAIQAVSSLSSHSWLQEAHPEIYNKLYLLKGTRKNPKGIGSRSTIYPAVISPSGQVYKDIENLQRFCQEHQLQRSNFRKMLKGKNHSSKGWRIYRDG